MDISTDEVVFQNDVKSDPEDCRICFVCGSLTQNERRITETETCYLHVPLAHKLGELVGDNFCIVVTKFDEICEDCLLVINEVDEIEYNLKLAKSKIINLLENKYNFNLSEVNAEDEIVYADETEDDKTRDSLVQCQSDNATEAVEEILDDSLSLTCDQTYDIKRSESPIETSLDVTTSSQVLCMAEDDNLLKIDKSSSKNILCEYCCICFSSVEDLNDHIIKSHNSKLSVDDTYENAVSENSNKSVSNIIYKCGICDFSHRDRIEVLKHVHSFHQIVCELCNLSFESVSSLLVHYASHGKSTGAGICSICEMPFPNRSVLLKHLAVHKKSGGPVVCNVCNVECADSLHAMHHRRNHHSVIKNLSCALCNVPVSSNAELKTHILIVHKGKKEYKCSECNMVFNRLAQYDNHKTYAHGNSKCRICGKIIEDKVKLRQHELRHTRLESNVYKCEICDKNFKTPGGLRVHSVSHTGKYKFFCEFCGKGFMSKVILEEHKGVHTKEERYVCDICGRKFVLNATFHLHKQWHKSPYPFPCKMCDRKFRYRSERSFHVRRDHTGETPYKCEHCECSFIKLSYLKKHLILHTKIYPHKCQECGKGYEQKKALAFHLAKIHDDFSMLKMFPKQCKYKVALRPEEYPVE